MLQNCDLLSPRHQKTQTTLASGHDPARDVDQQPGSKAPKPGFVERVLATLFGTDGTGTDRMDDSTRRRTSIHSAFAQTDRFAAALDPRRFGGPAPGDGASRASARSGDKVGVVSAPVGSVLSPVAADNLGAGEHWIPFERYSLEGRADGRSGVDPVEVTSEGTWGRAAAGLLLLDPVAQEVLLLKRSGDVTDPGLWSVPGGARQQLPGRALEDPRLTALAETQEELGKLPRGELLSTPFVYRRPKGDFTYHTYVLRLSTQDREALKPTLNWENDDSAWMPIRQAASRADVHPGLRAVLDKLR